MKPLEIEERLKMVSFVLGIGAAAIFLLIGGAILLPKSGKFFFTKDISKLNFEETNKVIKENIERSDEWILRSEKNFNETYKQAGKSDLPFRLHEYKIGNPDHSSRVNLAFPALATFMPAAIVVVEYKNGETAIYRKNTRLMGYCFTGVIKEIMTREVPKGLDEILEGII